MCLGKLSIKVVGNMKIFWDISYFENFTFGASYLMELLEEELHENREKSKKWEKLAFGMQSVEHRGKKRMPVMIMCSKPKKQPLQTDIEQRTPALFLRKKK